MPVVGTFVPGMMEMVTDLEGEQSSSWIEPSELKDRSWNWCP